MEHSKRPLLGTNRVLSRDEAEALDLQARIKIERQLTDAEAEQATNSSLPAHSKYTEYRNHSPQRRFLFDFLEPFAGRTVLDLGCGYNPTPTYLALAGAKRVYACDVSPRAVAHAKKVAEAAAVGDRVCAFVAAGELLSIASESIDVVHCESTLHHLVIDLASAEIWRVLKRGGKAGFKDPLGQNPVLEFARDHIPYEWKKAAKGTDRPLTFAKVERFGERFETVKYQGFGLLSMAVLALGGRGSRRLRYTIDGIDTRMLRLVPGLQRYCRFVVTCVQKG